MGTPKRVLFSFNECHINGRLISISIVLNEVIDTYGKQSKKELPPLTATND